MQLHHIALRTRDVTALAEFYERVVGLERRVSPSPPSVWLRCGEAIVMLEMADPAEPSVPAGGRELIAFCGDRALDEMRARLDEAGVTIEASTDHTVYFRDPDGRRVAFSTYNF